MEKKGQLQKSLDEGADQIDRAVNEGVGLSDQEKELVFIDFKENVANYFGVLIKDDLKNECTDRGKAAYSENDFKEHIFELYTSWGGRKDYYDGFWEKSKQIVKSTLVEFGLYEDIGQHRKVEPSKNYEKFDITDPVQVSILGHAVNLAVINRHLDAGVKYLKERYEAPPLKPLTAVFKIKFKETYNFKPYDNDFSWSLNEEEHSYASAYYDAERKFSKEIKDWPDWKNNEVKESAKNKKYIGSDMGLSM